VLLDQVAQRAGPGRGGVPAAGGGLQYPPPAGGLLPRGVQGGQGSVQVPGREGPPGLVGRLGDGQDIPGRLGDDRRVRPSCGAGVRFPALGGVACGGRGGLAGVGRAAGGLGGGWRGRCCTAGLLTVVLAGIGCLPGSVSGLAGRLGVSGNPAAVPSG
jgi:hypothetical protein